MSCDFIALVLQAAGGAIADTASTRKGSDFGTHILVAGLVFQVMSLLFFIGVAFQYARVVLKLKQGKDTSVQSLQRYQTMPLLDSAVTKRFNVFLAGKYIVSQ
jgi:hypothetical protein